MKRMMTLGLMLWAMAVILAPFSAQAARSVEVRIENKTADSTALLEGIEIRLFAFDGATKLDERQALTDGKGQVRFANFAAPADANYIVSALFQGVIYVTHGEAVGEGADDLEVLVPVFESTGSAATLKMDSLQIIVTENEKTQGHTVTEMLAFSNGGDKTILGGEDSMVTLNLDVPEGIRDFRPVEGFLSRHLGTMDGAVVYSGPLHPGVTRAVITYEVPAVASWFFRRRFANPVGEVSVYTGATGPTISSRQLASAEPIEFDGRSFLRYEADTSQIGPGLKFEVKRIGAVGGATASAGPDIPSGTGFIAGAVTLLLILILLIKPLVSPAPKDLVTAGRYVTPREAKRIQLERRKERHLEAVQEIDFDYQTGKLSEADYQVLRGQYKKQAVKVLAQIDSMDRPTEKVSMADVAAAAQAEFPPEAQGGAPVGTPVANLAEDIAAQPSTEAAQSVSDTIFCHQCGQAAQAGDRFCSQCGTPLRQGEHAESA